MDLDGNLKGESPLDSSQLGVDRPYTEVNECSPSAAYDSPTPMVNSLAIKAVDSLDSKRLTYGNKSKKNSGGKRNQKWKSSGGGRRR